MRMLPKPYLFLKSSILREWVRLKSKMNGKEARRVVGAVDGGEWGEKVERVWEFLKEGGGLKEERREEDGEEEGEGEGEEMDEDTIET